MKIACPQCAFSREVNPARIPDGRAIATCPKCGCRFRFSLKNGVEDILPPKGWSATEESEEEIRARATEAYAREAERFEDASTGEETGAEAKEGNPWDEAPGRKGWFSAFCQTCTRVLFSAPLFFRSLRPQSGQGRPLLFYLIICLFQSLVERFWAHVFHSMLSQGAGGDPQLEKLLAMLSPDDNIALGLLLRCGMLVAQLYVCSFLIYLAYRIVAPARASFSLLFQIWAYSAAPAIFCVIPALGSLAGTIWGLACLAVGCKAALDLTWPKTLFGFLPILLLLAPIFPELLALLRQ